MANPMAVKCFINGGEMLYQSDQLTNTTVFLWSRVTPPRQSPFGIRFEIRNKWEWFSEAKACVGYLRYVVLPKWFIIWLGMWDEDGFAPVTLLSTEEIFTEGIKTGAPEHMKDIPLMRNLIAKLGALFDASDDQITTGLREVALEFNEKWAKTPNYESEIQVFYSPMEVAEELIRQGESEKKDFGNFESWKSRLLSTCSNALSDENSQIQFLSEIGEIE